MRGMGRMGPMGPMGRMGKAETMSTGLAMFDGWSALTVRQPWAWLIVQGWKPIENRDWWTRFRGPFLVHAAKCMTRDEYEACRIFVAGFSSVRLPPMEALERGGIVGSAVLVDCVEAHDSDWFCGRYGFVLEQARPLPFVPCRGALGFWRMEAA